MTPDRLSQERAANTVIEPKLNLDYLLDYPLSIRATIEPNQRQIISLMKCLPSDINNSQT